ncbi:MAG: NAD(+) kinase [Pseudomonadota bacterium]
MSQFNTVGLMGRINKPESIDTLKKCVDVLHQHQRHVCVLDGIMHVLDGVSNVKAVARERIAVECDLVIVVGGDGSMLGAARSLNDSRVPVLGVNRGTLGFLTDVLPVDLERTIDKVLQGKFSIEERFLLSLEVHRKDGTVVHETAFNDVVLSSGSTAKMIEFESSVDDVFVNKQRADGLIMATPTGSTAYALSAGGPIMNPALDAIVLVPMFPHKLSSRPLVINGASTITLGVTVTDESEPIISCDAQTMVPLYKGDRIVVKKNPNTLSMMHPLGHDFYAACRDKLGWG